MTYTTPKPQSQRVKLDKTVKQYIIDAIDGSGYDLPSDSLITTEGKLRFLYTTFQAEYGWSIARYGEQKAFREWLMGLSSSFNVDFENYKILQLAVLWGSIPADYTDRQADKILENWFNFITVKTFQLFRKFGVK